MFVGSRQGSSPFRWKRRHIAPILCASGLLVACPPTGEPGGTDDGTDETGGPPPPVQFGEGGEGVLQTPLVFPTYQTLVIGAPDETWDDATRSGQISVLVSDTDGIRPPTPDEFHSTIVEGLADFASCGDSDYTFPSELGPDRRFGATIGWMATPRVQQFVSRLDRSQYRDAILAGSPGAEGDDGRISVHAHCIGCWEAPFTQQLVFDAGYGGAVHAESGQPPQDYLERVLIGAPYRANNDDVPVGGIFEYLAWDRFYEGGANERCTYAPPGAATNVEVGSTQELGSHAEFGRTLVSAPFSCSEYSTLVGAPLGDTLGADLSNIEDVGRVGELSVASFLGLEALEPGLRFGAALTAGNFNGSFIEIGHPEPDYPDEKFNATCFDLAASSPGFGNGNGAVFIASGSPQGLVANGPVLVRGPVNGPLEESVGGAASDDGRFGEVVVGVVLDDDRIDDLLIGSPGEEQGRGAVYVVPGAEHGLETGMSIRLTKQSLGIAGGEPGDEFGLAVSALLVGFDYFAIAIAAPGEDEGRGAVYLVRIRRGQAGFEPSGVPERWTQGMISGDEEPGDRFGAVLSTPRALMRLPYTF